MSIKNAAAVVLETFPAKDLRIKLHGEKTRPHTLSIYEPITATSVEITADGFCHLGVPYRAGGWEVPFIYNYKIRDELIAKLQSSWNHVDTGKLLVDLSIAYLNNVPAVID
jgi:hypothetical protein